MVSPMFADAVRNFQAGRLAHAEQICRQLLAADPRDGDSLHLLGLISYETGRFDQAVALISEAIAINPNAASYRSNLGRALQKSGRLDEAIASLRKALALNPGDPNTHNHLGNALRAQGKLEEAASSYRQGISLKPDAAGLHNNLGALLLSMGMPDEAALSFNRALDLNPKFSDAHNNLGNALRAQGKLEEAASSYRKAISLKPDAAGFHNNLGVLLHTMGRPDDAVTSLNKALNLKPDLAGAHKNLGKALESLDRFDEAIACYRKGIEIRPDHRGYNVLLIALHYSEQHSEADILSVARSFAGQLESPDPAQEFPNAPVADRRLRIGYVSADFRAHPVGSFLERVLSAHTATQVEIFCYSNATFADEVTTRLRAATDHWRSIAGMTDAAAAAMIRRDEIDILVDLSGHTTGHRLSLFAIKPAPVQVTWLGFWGTTGLSAIDYILADNLVIPPEAERNFSEKVWRLPGCYLCYTPPRFEIPPGPFPAAKNGFVTFGCFNRRSKISAGTIAVWSAILRRVENSRLFLKAVSFSEPEAQARLAKLFAEQGIAEDRLIMEAHSPPAEALAAYNKVDIALDPFPFAGGTTTADALWMGVPLVTLQGRRWAGRMSQSILAALGLTEWVAANEEEYVQIACRLAADLPNLGTLRSEIRQRMEHSSFCDGESFTQGLEDAYRGMWKIWCAEQAAK